MFQYIATTLTSGERDAVLVDPPMTTEQTARVIKWIEASGRTLKHIFITHGHGDHWFGTGPLLTEVRSGPRRLAGMYWTSRGVCSPCVGRFKLPTGR